MDEIKKEEYIIKPCTTCGNDASLFDMDRIRFRFDNLLAKKSFDEAEELINYWLKEVSAKKDLRSELELQNEYIGFLRKQGRKDDAILHAKRCVELIESLSLKDTISAATIYLNVATVYQAFKEPEIALSHFMKCEQIYDKYLKKDDKLFAGLYNNMALALVDLQQYDAAYKRYNDALSILNNKDTEELDAAITHLNLADLIYNRYKVDTSEDYTKYGDEIEKHCFMAWELLNKKSTVRGDYYRFVCEKCAPTFAYYGYFVYEKELIKRANER